MRSKREQRCPHCQASIESTYRFCLACGEELPQPKAVYPSTEQAIPRAPDGTFKCWQCKTERDAFSPTCPTCGTEFSKPPDATITTGSGEPNRILGKRSLMRTLVFLLCGIALLGAGALVVTSRGEWTGNESGLSWSSFAYIPIPRLFGDDGTTAGDKPKGVVANASEARVVDVADDGLIRVRIEGNEIEVNLAGASPGFVTQCLGETALARVRRILVDDAIVFVALDGKGEVNTSGRVAIQRVYIWQYDPTTGKVRFVNQELVGGGEVALKQVKLADSELGMALAAANERAREKERGRYEAGACE